MSKVTDERIAAIKALFGTGHALEEVNFADLIDAIQEAAQEHEHASGGGAGSGTGDAGPVINLQSGTAAAKPGSPAVGDVYIETDTSKVYACYSAGSWTEVGGGGGGAPTDASYVTLDAEDGLSAETRHRDITGADLHEPKSHGSSHGGGQSDPIPDASDAAEGIVELATVEEANAGTDTTRAVTPAGLLIRKAGTAIIGGDLTGDPRGEGALDIQTGRENAAQVASGQYSTALGRFNEASGEFAVAAGYQNEAGKKSTAVGVMNTASGDYSSAIGRENTASGVQSAAVGGENTASGDYAVAFGFQNTASGHGGVAVGISNNVGGEGAVAFGAYNVPYGNYSTAAGYYNTISVNGYGAVAVGYMNEANGVRSTAVGVENEANGRNSIAAGHDNTASGEYSTAVGATSTASGNYSIAIGLMSTASGYFAITIGAQNTASGNYSVAAGYYSTASGDYSLAFGKQAEATAARATAIGAGAKARIEKTTNICGPQIIRKDDGEEAEAAFESFCGTEVVLMSKTVDLTVEADQTITLPSGCKFWIDEIGVIVHDVDNLLVLPDVRFGIAGDLDKHLAATTTTLLTGIGKREKFEPLVPEDGETSLTAGVTNAATASTLLSRFYWKGLLIENQ